MVHTEQNQKLVAAALRRLDSLSRRDAFDPTRPGSVPTAKQQLVFDDFGRIKQQWIRAGNQSGKSATCARIVSWVAEEQHPVVLKRRAETDPRTTWAQEPLLILVCGRTGKQIEDSLWPKIRGFLEPGTFKEVRLGNILQRVELTNGNRFVFQSLENPNTARERLMSYVAHLTWCDELPPTMDLVRELLVRTQARNGYSLWSFTPTVVAIEIQRFVDSLEEPEGKVYRFHMLDNPLYSDPVRRQELLDRYKHLPQHVQEAIFEGAWLAADGQVYYFDYVTMVEQPQGYSPRWRHVEAVDPALKSALGLTIWAECPENGVWYLIHAEELKGILVPTQLVEAVRERTKNYNIVRRISDPHEVWYIQTAGSMGLNYMGVYKKHDRKGELIKTFQEALGSKVKIAPDQVEFITEIQECRWSDKTDGKIVNGSSYHLMDSAQYFCDNIPPRENKIQAAHWQEWLYKANDQRKALIEKKKQILERQTIRRRNRSWR